MTDTVSGQAVAEAMKRACAALKGQSDYLTTLDQAMGDGDIGINLSKIASALANYAEDTSHDDIGKFLAGAGMAANRAGPSTMGTLLATALMRAGKAVQGQAELGPDALTELFTAADTGIQERGRAQPGNKTIVDAMHPARLAFGEALAEGASLGEAGVRGLRAAEQGRDQVTPLRSQVGRASWVGERTEGKVDPGCAAFVIVLSAIVEPSMLSHI
jgi:dihydroxyacetone kinase-like protein